MKFFKKKVVVSILRASRRAMAWYNINITQLVTGFGSIPNTIKPILGALSNCLVSGLIYDAVKHICKKGLDSMRKEYILLFGLGVCDGEV